MTTEARTIVDRHLLYALEQAATAGMPPGWSRLRPTDPNQLRGGARILQRVAELGTRTEMTDELARIEHEIERNREERGGDVPGWLREVAAAIGHLSDRRQRPATGLASLALWQGWPPWDGPSSPLNALHGAHGALSPLAPPAGNEPPVDDLEAFLDEAARVLLRSLARRWAAEARQRERERSGAAGQAPSEPEGATP
jgi:hypothetical protein